MTGSGHRLGGAGIMGDTHINSGAECATTGFRIRREDGSWA